jgi:hypothetical protein
MVPSRLIRIGQRADGLEAVAVRRQAAHRVEGDRVAGHALVLAPQESVQAIGSSMRLVARGDAHLVRQPADGLAGMPVMPSAHSGVQGARAPSAAGRRA